MEAQLCRTKNSVRVWGRKRETQAVERTVVVKNKRLFVQTHPPDLDSPQSSAADGKKARAEEEDDFFFFFNYVTGEEKS